MLSLVRSEFFLSSKRHFFFLIQLLFYLFLNSDFNFTKLFFFLKILKTAFIHKERSICFKPVKQLQLGTLKGDFFPPLNLFNIILYLYSLR